MKILLMGPQGSGKGTLGVLLSSHLNVPLVSLGDLLRNLPENSPSYAEVNEAMRNGALVPLQIAASIIKQRLQDTDCSNGYILDGWCRRMDDVRAFNPSPDKVVVLDISRETSLKRVTGRRFCTSNGRFYNIYTLPKEQLKECTGELIQREDDTEDAVKTRLGIYYTQTQEVIDFFNAKGIVKVIDAEVLPQEVFKNALVVLGLGIQTKND